MHTIFFSKLAFPVTGVRMRTSVTGTSQRSTRRAKRCNALLTGEGGTGYEREEAADFHYFCSVRLLM